MLLASNSPRRRLLLGKLGVGFRVESAPVREFAPGELPAAELPVRNAELKAAAVARLNPDELVLGADTVIVFGGKIIGKPRDLADARAILRELSGHVHEVVTGVALIRLSDGMRKSWSEHTRVTFKKLDESAVDEYLRLVEVLDKAGAYALQEHPELLISAVDGDPDNVVGLPLGRLKREIAALTD